jgi:AcrR family transcriptional regulator
MLQGDPVMTTQNAPRTARQRARAELTREITEEARRQLAATGANGLSLRAVARELGMVSSALYRYYPSRDDLLTALIIDAYNAIGDAAETAIADTGSGAGSARARWLAACHAIRAWALARPHEYALIYGSPVPGYRAPEATIGPAARVPLAFVGVLADAVADGEVADGEVAADSDRRAEAVTGERRAEAVTGERRAEALTGALAVQAAALSAALSLDPSAAGASAVPPGMLVRGVIAWTQLFGMISFELFGQFVGSFEPADAFFAHAAAELATLVGLP